MIKAVIFDMDGVIIDSEPLWAEAQAEIFTSLGVEYNAELAKHTVGTCSFDTIDFWFKQQPWEGASYKDVEERIFSRMAELIRDKGKMMDGLLNILNFFRNKGLKIGLASGSPFSLIHLVIDQLGIKSYFEVIHSIDEEPFGKPHPAVYISAAQKLGFSPAECLAIEDSFNGLLSAKSARMKAIAYLPNGEFNNSRYDFADLKLSSYNVFDEKYYQYLQNLI